jgi:hypothetical protein
MDRRIYADGLDIFLNLSREDEMDIEGVASQFPLSAPGTLESLTSRARILDVGAGNGRKASLLARWLNGRGVRAIEIDSLEPTPEQRERLERTHALAGHYSGTIHDVRFQDFSVSHPYDILLLSHALYQFPRAADGTLLHLDKLPSLLAPDGVGIILHEDPRGDLHRIKHALWEEMQRKEVPVTLDVVLRSLESHEIPYKIGESVEFGGELDQLYDWTDERIGQAFEFLFSNSLQEPALTPVHHRRIGGYVRDTFLFFDVGCLENVNAVIWVYASDSAAAR